MTSSVFKIKFPIVERVYPRDPEPTELRCVYNQLRRDAQSNNRSAAQQWSYLREDFKALRKELAAEQTTKLETLKKVDSLLARIEAEGADWADMEAAGDDLVVGITTYRNDRQTFQGGRNIRRLVAACYRFVTIWKTIKKRRDDRTNNA